MERLLRWISRRCPLRVLTGAEGEYLRRHYVFGNSGALYLWPEEAQPRLRWLPFTVYLHEFVRPDEDRDLHNHPWHLSLSLVLSGGYEEERLTEGGVLCRRLRPGHLNVLRRDDFHRVVRLRGRSTWTLFVSGRYAGPWGFRDRETREYTGFRAYLRARGRLYG